MAQYTGTVKWFNNAKGYGFLGHDGGADVFVHYSSIQTEGYKTLKEGDEVTFDIIQGDKGPQADKVEILKGKMPASDRSFEIDNGSASTSPNDASTYCRSRLSPTSKEASSAERRVCGATAPVARVYPQS